MLPIAETLYELINPEIISAQYEPDDDHHHFHFSFFIKDGECVDPVEPDFDSWVRPVLICLANQINERGGLVRFQGFPEMGLLLPNEEYTHVGVLMTEQEFEGVIVRHTIKYDAFYPDENGNRILQGHHHTIDLKVNIYELVKT